MDSNDLQKRYPNLCNLSIAILESLAEKVIGEKGIDELRSPLDVKAIRDKLIKAIQRAEVKFTLSTEDQNNQDIKDAILDLPLWYLPSFHQSIFQFYEDADVTALTKTIQEKIKEGLPNLEDERSYCAAQLYADLIWRELSLYFPEFRNKTTPIILRGIEQGVNSLVAQSQILRSSINEKDKIKGFSKLPFLPEMFIGRRSDMQKIKQRLGVYDSLADSHKAVALRGLPGVGKTTIAWTIAHDQDVWNKFSDGILWTSLGETPNILSVLNGWYKQIVGSDEEELEDINDIKELASRLTGLLHDKQMLLIVDDVWKLEHARPFMIGGPKCATLITTRGNNLANLLFQDPDRVYLLDVLSPEDSFALTSRRAPTVAKRFPNQLYDLGVALEGLPLALHVAGCLLEEYSKGGSDISKLISEILEGARLLNRQAPEDRADLENFSTPTVAAILNKSTDLLDDDTRARYAFLCFLPCKPAIFDLEVLKEIWKLPDPTPAIIKLVNHGLVEYLAEENVYQMHALLIMHAKSLCS